ncbi:nucleotidyltransferase domain-containing protein [Candidatus Poriferisocius sp.]|uniref:nucleotidyltransferase domain-containing protein n=1 Tax=Candidatus Poriferisocius sp. TaxID=3101276 RepID=UPI003B019D53
MTGDTLVAAAAALPTLDVAQRIADVFVAEHGVAEVAVFGSVARGEATVDSDIDLVAIYPNMDYAQRRIQQLDLSSVAGKIAGRNVDVWVTDWPEWKWRSNNVTISFEHGILDDCVVLARQSSPYQHINKTQIGLPMSNKEEIEERLKDCQIAVSTIRDTMTISESEREAMLEENEEERKIWLQNQRIIRLRKTAAAAAESIEHSLKLLVALEGHHVPKTHSAVPLLKLLPNFISGELLGLLDEGEWERVRKWRQAGTYVDSWDKLTLSETEVAEEIERYYNTMIRILPFGIEEYENRYGTSILTNIFRKNLANLDRRFATLNLLTGEDRENYGSPTDERSGPKLRRFRRRKPKRTNPDQLGIP